MKKILLSILILVTLISFTACGKSGENTDTQNTDNATASVSPTESVTDTPSPTEVPTAVPTEEPTQVPTVSPTEVPVAILEISPTEEPTAVPTEEPVPVSSDSFFPVDVDSQKLEPVYEAYLDYMNNRRWSDFETGHFTLAYIDDDDIPELLIFDGEFHDAGAEIVKYDFEDSTAKKIDTFGSWGAMSYLPGQSTIFSFWMGQGYECYYTHEIDGFTAEMTTDLERSEEIADYTINGISSDSDTFNEVLDARFKASEDSISIGYADAIPFASNQNTAIFRSITKVISQGMTFKMPASMGMEDIDGQWNLFYGLVTDSSTGDILTSDDCQMTASIKIDSVNNSASFRCTFNNELYDDNAMTAEFVNEPFIDSNEYALWTIELFGESPNDIYNLTAYTENDTEYLYLTFETLISDADTRTFEFYLEHEKELDYANASMAYAKYNKKGSDPDNNIAAFTCTPFIIVSADQTDLITEYGLEPDLNGLAHTIVKSEDKQFTLYVNTQDTIFRFYENSDDTIERKNVTFDEFRKHVKNEYDGLMPVIYSEDDVLNECPVSYLIEEYYIK